MKWKVVSWCWFLPICFSWSSTINLKREICMNRTAFDRGLTGTARSKKASPELRQSRKRLDQKTLQLPYHELLKYPLRLLQKTWAGSSAHLCLVLLRLLETTIQSYKHTSLLFPYTHLIRQSPVRPPVLTSKNAALPPPSNKILTIQFGPLN